MKIDDRKLIDHLDKSNKKLVSILEEVQPFKVFQDIISDDSLNEVIETTGGYNYFRFETGGMNLSMDENTITQELLISFYSENRDDLDVLSIKIIAAMHGKLFKFIRSKKYLIKKNKEDKYIDEIQFFFNRRMKNVC
ncbi:hypothetical protein [Enterococcus sp. DIV1420a]|uniref:hypothetical protein n=1 Tax=Enterococcus TaxID=1350 RepID=UPI003F28FA52